MKVFLTIVLIGATAALTFIFRIPIPATGGYFNFGDVAVIFCGLFLGKKWGAIAGGIGSAFADLLGGFYIFIPITLVAKGLEGFLAGVISERKIYLFVWQKFLITVAGFFTILGVIFSGRYFISTHELIAKGAYSLLIDILIGLVVHVSVLALLLQLANKIYFKIKNKYLESNTNITALLLLVASFSMVIIYFITEVRFPGMGLASAISELFPWNILQAIVGAFGGYGVYVAVKKALPKAGEEAV